MENKGEDDPECAARGAGHYPWHGNQTSCSHLARHRCSGDGWQDASTPQPPTTCRSSTTSLCCTCLDISMVETEPSQLSLDSWFSLIGTRWFCHQKNCWISLPTHRSEVKIEFRVESEAWTQLSNLQLQLEKKLQLLQVSGKIPKFSLEKQSQHGFSPQEFSVSVAAVI